MQIRSHQARFYRTCSVSRQALEGVLILSKQTIRYAAGVEYDGSQFHGWQFQKGQASVQESVENALSCVAGDPIRVIAAGRTDSGVHALGQVIHFDSKRERSVGSWIRGANTHLPTGAVLRWVVPVGENFHARYSAIGRSYRYVICNRSTRPTYLYGRVAWDYRALNLERMRLAARSLLGRHDFTAYRAASCQARSPVRELLRLEANEVAGWVWFDLFADAFLQRMVRNIIGVLLDIGAGEQDVDWAAAVLSGRDRTKGGVTARAEGLYFINAKYSSDFPQIPTMEPCRFW